MVGDGHGRTWVLLGLLWVLSFPLPAQRVDTVALGRHLQEAKKQPDSAWTYLKKALAEIGPDSTHAWASRVYFELGASYYLQGELDSSRHYLQAALTGGTITKVQADAWLLISHIEALEAQYTAARQAAQEARQQYSLLGDTLGLGRSWLNESTAWYKAGELDRAVAGYLNALAFFKGVGQTSAEASTLLGLGSVHLDQGSYTRARSHFDEANALYQSIQDTTGQAQARQNLSLWYARQGLRDSAQAELRQSAVLYLAAEDSVGWAETQNLQGNLAFEAQQWAQARDYYAGYAA
ncbi:MAG TPA: hypothetical protein DCE41_06030, partial [Cytophagales bacterium]|nr:hypothetical protein [Cytophagales bacterium]